MSEDITPEDSVAPVYLVPIPAEVQADIAAHREQPPAVKRALADDLKNSAVSKLVALGLTQEEAEALYRPSR